MWESSSTGCSATPCHWWPSCTGSVSSAACSHPTLLDAAPNRPLAQALGIDLALLAVFALQHSGMARPAFKRWWTRIVPEAAERSTYVLLSSLAVGAFFAFWQPIGAVIWQTEGTTRAVIIGVYLFGWALLFYTTFLIDHFDLFGLKQVWRQLIGRDYRPPQFFTPSLYRWCGIRCTSAG